MLIGFPGPTVPAKALAKMFCAAWDYLSVLADAFHRYGAPEAIETDDGGIFYSNQALQLYDMLSIRKERND